MAPLIDTESDPRLAFSLAEIGAPTRIITAFEKQHIYTVADYVCLTPKEKMAVRNVGRPSISLLDRLIRGLGIDPDEYAEELPPV